ncbi:DNA-binding winged helix-turn-helix (wHTH) protein/tetratricopeptide (TPR) repeat protein [Lysobacter niastensis]|uniref:DNA-binding winged helix-turn-helix (WHTH) protein/tetratricopeptide (TPR) repeat protein n=1 Tax=Lysobacter niastensis TaxID=380629 RepID=A0ABU1W752_9GAMM|nr:winged helix-turn-helix domain-containing protein [Lysobacter niastensis]MDR7133422.1 DNA-binding winged helix-turn-helix (wHTH) protein/tetratricopeptide (TPR) repeat protein [Lysobacter niastensis]
MRLPKYRFGPFELDAASRELSRDGERVALAPKSFECLAYLITHRDRAVGRDELIAAVWGRVEVSDAVVAQTLLRARKALDDTGNRQSTIRTVSRFGYQWVAPVQEVPASGDAVADAGVRDMAAEPVSDAVLAAPPRDGAAKSRRARWPWLIGLALLAGAAVALFHFLSPPDRVAQKKISRDVVLVLPVAVAPAGSDDAWVRLGAMDYIASRLRGSGMTVLPSDQAMHLSKQIGDHGPTLDAAELQKLTTASSAGVIVWPEATRDGNGWRVRLNLHDASGPHAIDARGATPLAAAASATDSWLSRLGRVRKDSDAAPSPLTERVQRVDAELITGQLDAVRRLIDAAPANERDDPLLRVREGQLEYRAGRMDAAAGIFQKLLDRRPEVSDGIRARALMGKGAIAIRGADPVAAEADYAQALAVLERSAEQRDDPALLGNAYNGRGVARIQQGKMQAAVSDLGMARIAMQRSGSMVEAAGVGVNLAIIEVQRGHYAQALQEFDRAIAVFERFEVRDYLAAALMGKANTQLKLAQPADAVASIQRTDALSKSLEDNDLAIRIATVRVEAMLAVGRLGEAERSIASLRALGEPETSQVLQSQMLRLRMAQGDLAQAGALARLLPNAEEAVQDSLVLAGVQGALKNQDLSTAKAWLDRSTGEKDESMLRTLSRALVARAQRRPDDALQLAREANAMSERSGVPDDRIQAGVLLARVLLEQGQTDRASAVLGDLDAFSSSDYRVAWTTLALYRALGDEGMARNALTQVGVLRGERDPALEPAL